MSMNWMGGLNHKTHCDSYFYTKHITLSSKVPESIYQVGATSLWPVATVEGDETLNIYIKKTCYEYELDGGSQVSIIRPTVTPTLSSTCRRQMSPISGRHCMSIRHGEGSDICFL